MVKIIALLPIQTIPAQLRRTEQTGIVEIALGDQVDAPIETLRLFVHGLRQLLQKGFGGEIQDGVDRIQAQGINMTVIQ
jgi:hypothetical protein